MLRLFRRWLWLFHDEATDIASLEAVPAVLAVTRAESFQPTVGVIARLIFGIDTDLLAAFRVVPQDTKGDTSHTTYSIADQPKLGSRHVAVERRYSGSIIREC